MCFSFLHPNFVASKVCLHQHVPQDFLKPSKKVQDSLLRFSMCRSKEAEVVLTMLSCCLIGSFFSCSSVYKFLVFYFIVFFLCNRNRLAPYLRIPLLLGFLGTSQRVGALADDRLQARPQQTGRRWSLYNSHHHCHINPSLDFQPKISMFFWEQLTHWFKDIKDLGL